MARMLPDKCNKRKAVLRATLKRVARRSKLILAASEFTTSQTPLRAPCTWSQCSFFNFCQCCLARDGTCMFANHNHIPLQFHCDSGLIYLCWTMQTISLHEIDSLMAPCWPPGFKAQSIEIKTVVQGSNIGLRTASLSVFIQSCMGDM